MEIGERIKALMQTKGISIKEMASAVGVSPAAVSQWFTKSRVSKENLVKVASFLEVGVESLVIGGDEFDMAASPRGAALELAVKELLLEAGVPHSAMEPTFLHRLELPGDVLYQADIALRRGDGTILYIEVRGKQASQPAVLMRDALLAKMLDGNYIVVAGEGETLAEATARIIAKWKHQRTTANSAFEWPFESLPPDKWRSLSERQKGRVEAVALAEIRQIEAEAAAGQAQNRGAA